MTEQKARGYVIPAEPHRTELIVVNSRFITSIAFTPTVEEAKAFLASVRAEMPDATHHVYAFRVGHGNSVIEGMSDDGEPSGTAGPPVLAVLRGSEIGDITIVITRYFGGTKLGTGGLVRAYGDSARTGLDSLPVTRKIEKQVLALDLPYSFYQPVKRLIEQHEGSIDEEDFAGEVTVWASFPVDCIEAFSAAVVDITHGTVHPLLMQDAD
jgi:uncharacterized YigZ family protein